ncbi:hypothetical protein SZN_12943 [Streptomyces zinciresistens K42]|uniref:UbiA prenyltransferase n=1 Tax=Streptomyces zinciresistens K42 TaxID=700597 RepID=G2GAS1_9ACTN|nr:UbiA family prenyltransferase [Streptomyces zinciresistens]EGX59406.1 hypothetical protein SZN_12943 [Streptomyces zinciresistens K42]
MNRGRAWAELLRLPALFTVPGDALSGAVAAGGRPTPRTLLAIGSSLCLYEAGMALNDWADRAEDAAERPHRPLPSGRVHPSAALAAAGALTAAGLGLAACAGRPALAVAGPLAATVWAYDLGLKHTPAGPVAMAAARGLDHLLGAATTGGPRAALSSAALLGTHTLAVTAVSRRETRGGSSLPPLAALAATVLLALLASRQAPGPDTPPAPGPADAPAAPDRGNPPRDRLRSPSPRARSTDPLDRAARPAGPSGDRTPRPARTGPPPARAVGSTGANGAGARHPARTASPPGRALGSAGGGVRRLSPIGPLLGRVLMGRLLRPVGAPADGLRRPDRAGAPPGRAPGPTGAPGGGTSRPARTASLPGRAPRTSPAETGSRPHDRPGPSPDSVLRAAFATLYAVTAGRPYAHAALNPSPPLTQRAVGGGIRATIPLQAALAARAGAGPTALAIAALAPLGRKYARKVSIT